MSCGDFEKLVPQLAGWRLIEAGRQVAALRHAEVCANCGARLANERVLISGIRAVRAELAKEEAPPQLEGILLDAFRQQSMAARTPVTSMPAASVPVLMPQRTPRLNWRVAAIAAAILLVTSIAAIVGLRSWSRERPSPERAVVAPDILPASAPLPKDSEQLHQVAEAPRPRRRAKPLARRAETVTEYFPLIAGDDLEQLEFTQIVRVELTPAALREVGLPSSYAVEGDFVKADLVLGPDGIARAIRFVR